MFSSMGTSFIFRFSKKCESEAESDRQGREGAGKLLGSRTGRGMGEAARLDWSLTYVLAVDGQRLPLRRRRASPETTSAGKKCDGWEGESSRRFTYVRSQVNVVGADSESMADETTGLLLTCGRARRCLEFGTVAAD